MANLTLPKMDITDYDIELFNEDTTIQPLKLPEGKTMSDVFKDPRTPILAFTGALWKEIRYCVEKNPTQELAMFLVIKRMADRKPHFLAFDMFMPKQHIAGASVRMYGDSCQEYYNALKDHDYFKQYGFQRNLCHLHSHGSFATFWSATDDNEQFSPDELGFYDDYRLYVVVNAKGDIKASLVNYYPTLYRVDCATALFFAKEEYAKELTPKRKKELDAIMEENMERVASVPPVTSKFYRTSVYGYYGGHYNRTGFGSTRDLWDDQYLTTNNLLNPSALPAKAKVADIESDDSAWVPGGRFCKGISKLSTPTVMKILNIIVSIFTEMHGYSTVPALQADINAFMEEHYADYVDDADLISTIRLALGMFKNAAEVNNRIYDEEDAVALGAYVAILSKIASNCEAISEFGICGNSVANYTSSTRFMLSEDTMYCAADNELNLDIKSITESIKTDLVNYINDIEVDQDDHRLEVFNG